MKKQLCLTLALLICAAAANDAAAQSITPVNAGIVHSPIIAVNNGPGVQTDPHVSGNVAAYVDLASGFGRVRYFDFLTSTDAAVPPTDPTDSDTLPSIDGTRIVFSRQKPDRTAIFLYDTATSSLTEIDPHPGSVRFATAIGGSRVAFVNAGGFPVVSTDIFVHDLVTNTTTNLTSGTGFNNSTNVAPDGNTVVWDHCDVPVTHCATNAALWQPNMGVWSVITVADTPGFGNFRLDTDGIWFVYDSDRPSATGNDIYFKPIGGDGIERHLAIAGVERNPHIAQGVIAFEGSESDSPTTPPDMFVYVIATNRLYQITSTPSVDEVLNDVTVLPNGDIRVVWSANADSDGRDSIFATTFTPEGVHYNVCLLYDPLVAKKAGSVYPIKLQLCDSNGNNLSSPSLALHAIGVTRVSNSAPGPLDDTGNANPDFDFRYDSGVLGYLFNLSLKCTNGLCFSTGTYTLNFTAGADPTVYSAVFAVK